MEAGMRRARATAALAGVLAGAALAPVPAAHAGTATAAANPFCSVPPDMCGFDVQYTAAPGEANRVEVFEDAGRLVIRDSGAPVTAGEGCAPLGPDAASCRFASPDESQGRGLVYVRAGDLDDSISALSDDLFLADGGPGSDVLTGFAGSPELFDGGPGDDTIDGGAGGHDTASYEGRPTGVTVDLRAGRGGEGAAERDTLRGIEDVIGGEGGDVLIGDSLANEMFGAGGADNLAGSGGRDALDGGPGRDRLAGQNENDRLSGGDGNDRLEGGRGGDRLTGGAGNDLLFGGPQRNLSFGGPGNDLLHLVNRRREQGSCGAGRDVAEVDRSDRLRSCERVIRRR